MKRSLLLTALLLSACAQPLPLRTDGPALSSEWRHGPASTPPSASSGTSAATAWWASFNDPELNRLEALALDQNLDVQQALSRLEQSRASFNLSEVNLLPNVGLDATAGQVEQSLNSGLGVLSKMIPNFPRTVDRYQLGLSGSWDLDFAGSLKRQREAAKASVMATQNDLQSLQISITAEVADAYFLMLGAAGQKAALEHQLALLNSQFKVLKAREKTGTATRQELYQFEAGLEELSSNLPNLASAIESQQVRIAVLLGQNPSAWRVAAPTAVLNQPVPDPVGPSPVALIRSRPDVLAAEQRLKASGARVAASLAEYYPKVSLIAAFGQDSNVFSTFDSSRSAFGQTLLGFKWRLFDFGRIDAEVKVARGKEQEALLAYRLAVLRAVGEVETGFTQLAANREQLQRLAAKQKSLEKALGVAQRAYLTGAASEEDVLQAQLAVVRVTPQVVQSQREVARAIVAAARALGGPL